ncbi:hypothetical protein EJ04DRAFT_511298 [Polyplosphaeria fusca]|uniref:Apple domain-containing protein n=1 Tax=Polyplosphaeria fusca TaxID=682080 RepID=A0A9P4QYL5_9PLEO|nr:hypothetical protein EJ04DRAFT_511298 [Polyplosphaeria fusca]
MTDQNCTETTLTTPQGLDFSLYCDTGGPGTGEYTDATTGADNISQCLERCSEHPTELCGAVAFDHQGLKCYLMNSTVTTDLGRPLANWTLGIANRTQLAPLSRDCTNNAANQTSQNGLPFTIACGQAVQGLDVCGTDSFDCRKHTATLADCLDHCSTLHPLCTGVTWDARMENGFQNCYPKRAAPRQFDDARKYNKNSHSAKAIIAFPTEEECHASADGKVTASNADEFELSCNEGRYGTNVTVQHAESHSACVDACATYSGTAPCQGAVFDANMDGGYENCYLKSDIGGAVGNMPGVAFARRLNGTNSSDPANNSSQSKAWIAGPVIGGIVAVVLVVGALWWWRKRRRGGTRRTAIAKDGGQTEAWPEKEGWAKQELGSDMMIAPAQELDSRVRPSELGTEGVRNGGFELEAPDERVGRGMNRTD